MPALRPRQLVEAIESTIAQSGAAGVLVSTIRQHPRRFAITRPSGDFELWVYAWTLTPGGRPQLANEYRIQMTSVTSPLALNPAGPTVLIGYEPNLKMIAGFDIERHRTFTEGSPSIQIDITALHTAIEDGLAFHRKDNTEIAVAIRPDQFFAYVDNATELHRYGRERRTLDALGLASSLEPITAGDLDQLSAPRRRVVETVSRLSRSANFRMQVLQAYDHRCAVTRMQLRLVDAAHILPVAAPGSSDAVTNGLALSPTYHRAFDSGLIYLGDNMTMRINADRQAELTELNLDRGLAELRASLGRIYLPPNRVARPDPRMIRRANRFRRIDVA